MGFRTGRSSNSETRVQPYAKGSRVKTMSELRSKDTQRQISGVRRLGQNGSHTESRASLASRRPLGPMIHHSGGTGAIFDNFHFLSYFLKFRAAGGAYSEASRPKRGPHTKSRASLAPRRPLGPIIHHSGGIGPIFDNLQYLDIYPGFFRLLVKFSAVAHILGDILAPQGLKPRIFYRF